MDGTDLKGGNWEYDIVEMGYKYNLTDYAACFGLWQLNQIELGS